MAVEVVEVEVDVVGVGVEAEAEVDVEVETFRTASVLLGFEEIGFAGIGEVLGFE